MGAGGWPRRLRLLSRGTPSVPFLQGCSEKDELPAWSRAGAGGGGGAPSARTPVGLAPASGLLSPLLLFFTFCLLLVFSNVPKLRQVSRTAPDSPPSLNSSHFARWRHCWHGFRPLCKTAHTRGLNQKLNFSQFWGRDLQTRGPGRVRSEAASPPGWQTATFSPRPRTHGAEVPPHLIGHSPAGLGPHPRDLINPHSPPGDSAPDTVTLGVT